ncbi:MAG: GatB/YqeY domain-containing protein [Desulfovibrionaceae bacterium]
MLFQKIDNDYLLAYKKRETQKVTVLRLLKTAIKNMEIECMRPLSDNEILDIIIKQAKQRNDSIIQFEQAKRNDLADIEKQELLFLQEYLPAILADDVLKNIILKIIKEVSANKLSDMGKVMNMLNTQYKGQFDGKAASSLVKEALQNIEI